VTSLTTIMDVRQVEDNLEIGPLVDGASIPDTPQGLESLKRYALGKEMYRGRIVSEDGKATLIVCQLQEQADKTVAAAGIKDIVAKAALPEKVFYAGLPFQLLEINGIVRTDLVRLVPFAAVLILLALFFSFRSARGVVLPLLCTVMSGVWALGIMTALGVSFSLLTNIIPVVLLAVGNAYGIHVISRFEEDALKSPAPLKEVASSSLPKVIVPVLLAAVTTIAGFISFIFGSYLTMIRQFGIFSSLGIFFALVLALTFVPAVLSFLKPRMPRKERAASGPAAWKDLWILKVLRGAALNHSGWVLGVGAVLFIVAAVGLPFMRREVDILSYFKRTTDICKAEEVMKRQFGGSIPLQILVQGDLKDPRVLREMKDFETYLKGLTLLRNVNSIVDLVEEMSFLIDGRRAIPSSSGEVSNLWFLMEGGQGMSQLVNDDATEGIIQATVANQNSRETAALVKALRSYIDGHESPDVRFQFAGIVSVYNTLDKTLLTSQISSLAISLVLIYLCNVLLLGSFVGGLLGMMPIAFTLVALLGSMGLFGIPLDIATVLIGSISMGIGIDYSIHFMNRFRLEYALTGDRTKALSTTVTTTGRAILVNVVTVALGFLTLAFGSFIPLQRFGILIAITMLSSGMGALLLLPALMQVSPGFAFRNLAGHIEAPARRERRET
jgi:predicted RND superfamily exporter protein